MVAMEEVSFLRYWRAALLADTAPVPAAPRAAGEGDWPCRSQRTPGQRARGPGQRPSATTWRRCVCSTGVAPEQLAFTQPAGRCDLPRWRGPQGARGERA